MVLIPAAKYIQFLPSVLVVPYTANSNIKNFPSHGGKCEFMEVKGEIYTAVLK